MLRKKSVSFKIFKFKDCQLTSWKNGHKEICNQNETLLRLSLLPRYSYNDSGFSFMERKNKCHEGGEISSSRRLPVLPAYEPKKANEIKRALENQK